MYSDVSQNSADGSKYLVHEIRRQMNVISIEAQPSAGMFLFPFHFILCLHFCISSLLGFIARPAPPHHSGALCECIFHAPVSLIALRMERQTGSSRSVSFGCQDPAPQWDADSKTDSTEGL